MIRSSCAIMLVALALAAQSGLGHNPGDGRQGAAFAAVNEGSAGGTTLAAPAAERPDWQPARWHGELVELRLENRQELEALLRRVPLIDFNREQLGFVGGQLVLRIRVDEDEWQGLRAAGYSPQRVRDWERETQEWMEDRWREQAEIGGEILRVGEKGVYHTYSQLENILLDTENDHPNIAQMGSIGRSVQNRELWTLVISDNIGVEEPEPEVRLSAAIHGDEKIAMEMLLYLIEYLTDSYGQPGYEDVTYLVDNYEIHFLPLHNPDGHVYNMRYNANYYDINRNFPVPDGSIGDDWTYHEEPETVLFKDWGFAQHFVISLNGHSGALVVNYPWDYSYARAPDNEAIIQLSEEYSYYNQPMWNGGFWHGITHGADWYQVKGSLQDWSYAETGCIDATLELSNDFNPPARQLDDYWDDNRESFMHWIKAARYGVNGRVTQAGTGLPLDAKITVAGNSVPVFTDPNSGDYYKLLDTGTYTLLVESDGYRSRQISGVHTTWGTPTVLDVALSRQGGQILEWPLP